MKKVLLTAVFAMAGLFATAQDGGMKFGAKLGPNFSTLTGDARDATVKVGFHAGVFAEFMITENIGLQPEVLFSLQGSSSDYNYGYYDFDYYYAGWEKLNLAYVNVPILGTYHFGAVKGLSAHFGPQVGVLVSAKEKGKDYNEFDDLVSYSRDVKDSFKTIDISLAAGASYEFDFGLIATLRGTFGLSNIYDGPGGYKYRNNLIQISAGYSFL